MLRVLTLNRERGVCVAVGVGGCSVQLISLPITDWFQAKGCILENAAGKLGLTGINNNS